MVKLKEENTAPVSKYAAKKAKAKAKEVVSAETTNEVVDNTIKGISEDVVNEVVESGKRPHLKQKTKLAKDVSITDVPAKPKTKTVVGKDNRELGIDVPEHILEVAYIIKYNAAIRRFTSLNILNHLIQTGRIKKDGKGNYIKFLWNKFRVSSDGLTNEYLYSEQFFLKALVGAFGQFASAAQDTISIFMDHEGIGQIEP